MDFKQIDKTLDKYFEGLTSLEEEKTLKKYFTSGEIAQAHQPYKAMFDYYEQAKNVTNPRTIRLNEKRTDKHKKYYAVAAALLIGLGLFGLINNPFRSNNGVESRNVQVSNENPEKKKEAAKEIQKFAENLNDGFQKTGAISIFGQTTEKVFNLKKEKKEKK